MTFLSDRKSHEYRSTPKPCRTIPKPSWPVLDRRCSTAFWPTRPNLHPQSLESRFCQSIRLSPTAIVSIQRVRTMNFPQALFWFRATFVSDQKEEEILLMGIDLHSLREVRHWDSLLASSCLSELPEALLPEARHAGLIAGYRCACDRVAHVRAGPGK